MSINSVYLTGDIHGDIRRLLRIDDEQMTKEDIIMVLGDFGVVWKENSDRTLTLLELLSQKNFTTAFVDGNHENFKEIKKLESIVYWNGGYIGVLPFGIIHLLRGEIYNLGGKRIGVCGGANSVDKIWRKEGRSWWAEEEISEDDVKDFEANLNNGDYRENKIDIMLSHDAPANIIPVVKLYSGINDGAISNSQKQLDKIDQMADISKWYFGHWHIDTVINEKFICLYKSIIKII